MESLNELLVGLMFFWKLNSSRLTLTREPIIKARRQETQSAGAIKGGKAGNPLVDLQTQRVVATAGKALEGEPWRVRATTSHSRNVRMASRVTAEGWAWKALLWYFPLQSFGSWLGKKSPLDTLIS